ncbi:hypothetical protein NEOLEDRAFT_1240635 [Neolentinus lepideus HHB14362 ss-1]|uniref:WD40 repeat-like protein n=1 Tax=Neolentinus lepideus HHB14362 ss-1 TaxID=1314782 RepID=A0A165TPD7_9AGAM|nr:hypothetical protein NEOLEDRAFT_1240635 [Neolentinus lepideus HHB14362 ss-1]
MTSQDAKTCKPWGKRRRESPGPINLRDLEWSTSDRKKSKSDSSPEAKGEWESPSSSNPFSREKTPTRGVERLVLDTRAIPDVALRNLIEDAKDRLAKMHKRVDGNQRILADGVVMDWLLDHSKYEEKDSRLLNAEGTQMSLSFPSSSRCGMDSVTTGLDPDHAIVISDSEDEGGRQSSPTMPVAIAGPAQKAVLDYSDERDPLPQGSQHPVPAGLRPSDEEACRSRPSPRARSRTSDSGAISADPDPDSSSGSETSDTEEFAEYPHPGYLRQSTVERILFDVNARDVAPSGRARPDMHNDAISDDSDESDEEMSCSSGEEEQPQAGHSKTPSRHRVQQDRSRGRQPSAPRKRTARCSTSPTPPRDDGHSVVIPKAKFARPRRLLVPQDPNTLVVTVQMRGDIQFIRARQRVSEWSMPMHQYSNIEEPIYRRVEDAILTANTVVIGYSAGPCQISLVPLASASRNKRPSRTDIIHTAHESIVCWRRDRTCDGRISCLGAMSGHELNFFSGGYDKRVVHWKIDGSGNADTQGLPVYHSGPVHAIAYRGRDKTVLSSSGRNIYETNMDKAGKTKPVKKSTAIRHIHVHPQDPNLVVLEMRDMDDQIHIYDVRAGSFDRSACLRFGRDEHRLRLESTRYRRGSIFMSYMCLGYSDGQMLIWDYRFQKDVAITSKQHRPEPIVHTALFQSDVLAYGGYTVTFWPT